MNDSRIQLRELWSKCLTDKSVPKLCFESSHSSDKYYSRFVPTEFVNS